MAYSNIIVEFIEIPTEDQYLGIDEVISGLGLNEIFKIDRTAAIETKIPPLQLGNKYGMNVEQGISIEDIGINYTPIGGTPTQAPLSGFPVIDLPNGGYTIEVLSEEVVIIYDIATGNSIAWPHGSFSVIGTADYYEGYISENYKIALDADYNSTSLFTIESTNGAVNTGLGTVKITANYPNAVFSVPELFPFVTITINNEIETPVNNVSPNSLIFNVEKAIPDASGQFLEITAEMDSWNVQNPIPVWLNVSVFSGTESGNIEIIPVNYSNLSAGTYEFTLVVNVGNDVFNISIFLNVSEKIRNPFKKDNLYFTREDVSVGFLSELDNTFLNFEIEIKTFKINTNQPEIYNRSYNFPLFRRSGNFYVGEIVEDLINEILDLKDFIPDFKSNYVKKQFKPAEITISLHEKKYSDNSLVMSAAFDMFKMIKGYRPFMTYNQLALLTVSQQEITRITPNSIIATSFVYIGKPRILIKKNNDVIEDFEVDNTDDEIIYSYYRFINNLKPGDSIEIIIVNGLETRSQRFLVFKKGTESSYFLYENEFGLIEPYEFTGRRRVSSTFKHSTTNRFKNRFGFEEKVISELKQTLTINTGYLLKTDHRVINAIIRSKNVWCAFYSSEGNYLLVDSTSTKLVNQDTDNSEEQFDIDFNILENTDASIYPQ